MKWVSPIKLSLWEELQLFDCTNWSELTGRYHLRHQIYNVVTYHLWFYVQGLQGHIFFLNRFYHKRNINHLYLDFPAKYKSPESVSLSISGNNASEVTEICRRCALVFNQFSAILVIIVCENLWPLIMVIIR